MTSEVEGRGAMGVEMEEEEGPVGESLVEAVAMEGLPTLAVSSSIWREREDGFRGSIGTILVVSPLTLRTLPPASRWIEMRTLTSCSTLTTLACAIRSVTLPSPTASAAAVHAVSTPSPCPLTTTDTAHPWLAERDNSIARSRRLRSFCFASSSIPLTALSALASTSSSAMIVYSTWSVSCPRSNAVLPISSPRP